MNYFLNTFSVTAYICAFTFYTLCVRFMHTSAACYPNQNPTQAESAGSYFLFCIYPPKMHFSGYIKEPPYPPPTRQRW